jgi:hypothetical protein
MARARFDAGVGSHPDEDDVAYAVLVQMHIEVGVGEAGPVPVFLDDDVAGLGAEAGVSCTASTAEGERLGTVCRRLRWCQVRPSLEIRGLAQVVGQDEDWDPGLTYSCEDPFKVGVKAD